MGPMRDGIVDAAEAAKARAVPLLFLGSYAGAERRDFVKSAAERARCWAGEAHRGRGSAWPLSMRRERRPRSNVEVEASAGPVSWPVWRGRRGGECGRQRSVAVDGRDHTLSLFRGLQSFAGKYSEFYTKSF